MNSIANHGDFAIEFIVSYFIEPLPRTRVTDTAKKYLIDTPLEVNKEILKMSFKHGVQLSTPTLYNKVGGQ